MIGLPTTEVPARPEPMRGFWRCVTPGCQRGRAGQCRRTMDYGQDRDVSANLCGSEFCGYYLEVKR